MENLDTLSEFEERPITDVALFKLYYLAFGFLVFPLVCLLVFILDMIKLRATGMVLWAIFLVSLMPCSLTAGILSTVGLVRANKNKDSRNKSFGIAGMVLSFGGIFGGLLAIGLLYVVLGG